MNESTPPQPSDGAASKKLHFALGLGAVLAVTVFGIGGFFGLRSGGPIEIGAILALTGSIADQGLWVQHGLELAREEINREGIRGRKLVVIYEDARLDPKWAIAAYHNLKLRHKLPAVITMGSSVGITLTPILNDDKVIQMGVATSTPEYSTPDDFSFRVFEASQLETKYLAEAIRNAFGFDAVAMLWIHNNYGKGLKESFEAAFRKVGGRIVFSQAFEHGEREFKGHLLTLVKAKPDAIVLAPHTEEGALIVKQARELGIDLPLFSSQAIVGKALLSIAGKRAEGLLIVGPQFDVESAAEPIRGFREAYAAKYGENPEMYAARAYDALRIIAKALTNCGESDTECIKSYLFGVRDYVGVSGTLSFDRHGDVIRPLELRVVEGGQVVRYRR